MKADWSHFSEEPDDLIGLIPPKSGNYDRFVAMVNAIGKKHTLRGFRKEYILCWQEDAESLYEKFMDSGHQASAEEILKSLDKARREKWSYAVDDLSFVHSSRKA